MSNKIDTILLQGFPLLADKEGEDVIIRQAEWLAIHINNIVPHSQPDEIRVFETPYYEEVEDIALALEEAGFNVAACSTGIDMSVRCDYEVGYEIRLNDRQSNRGLSVLVVDPRKSYLLNSLKYIARIECAIRASSYLSPVLVARVDDEDLRYVNDIIKEMRAADYKAYRVQGGEEIEVHINASPAAQYLLMNRLLASQLRTSGRLHRQIERSTFRYESEYLELEEQMLNRPASDQPQQIDIGISHADEPVASYIAWLLLKQGYEVDDVYRAGDAGMGITFTLTGPESPQRKNADGSPKRMQAEEAEAELDGQDLKKAGTITRSARTVDKGAEIQEADAKSPTAVRARRRSF